jgi:exosome complex RNA-binding protein Csl4
MPISIPIPAESAIASYSYTDIADGTGVRTFYGGSFNQSGGQVYSLTTELFKHGRANHFEGTTNLDLSAFTRPVTIMGTAIVDAYITTSSGDGAMTVTFYKVSGAVETAFSSDISSLAASSGSHHLIKVPLTRTNFKIGDILRLKVVATGTNAEIYCTDETNKIFKVNVPFKIEL